jgi:hypothetical protein
VTLAGGPASRYGCGAAWPTSRVPVVRTVADAADALHGGAVVVGREPVPDVDGPPRVEGLNGRLVAPTGQLLVQARLAARIDRLRTQAQEEAQQGEKEGNMEVAQLPGDTLHPDGLIAHTCYSYLTASSRARPRGCDAPQ